MSWTGNTKKVAEAIYDAIPQPKEIRRVSQNQNQLITVYWNFSIPAFSDSRTPSRSFEAPLFRAQRLGC